MPDYRTMFDRDYISHFDLDGKEVTVKIVSVKAGELTANGGKKTKKPVIYFEGAERGLALNKTNSKTIAGLYGNKTEDWIGKRITMFTTTTSFGGEVMDCIRIKPQIPAEASK